MPAVFPVADSFMIPSSVLDKSYSSIIFFNIYIHDLNKLLR